MLRTGLTSVAVSTLSPLERVREAVGSQKAIADALGLSQPTVHEWFKRGQPPADRCIALEDLSGGTVTRYDLRPDIFGASPIDTKAA